MKLIIDISNKAYESIKSCGYVPCDFNMIKAIREGILLDDLRAEVEKISIAPFATAYTAKSEALKIIDKYTKESENKE